MELFNLTKDEYKQLKKTEALRLKVQTRSSELNVTTDHTADQHWYVRDNIKYPSVTGKLKLLKDSGLTNWKLNRAMDYIFQHFPEMTQDNLLEYLEKAKQAPQLEFEGAGNIGREVHGWREEQFNYWMTGESFFSLEAELEANTPPIEHTTPPVISCCRAIKKFVQEHSYVPVACELMLADHDLKLGGCLDDLGFVDGELAIVDLKTSNIGDKNSYFHQVALYYLMFYKAYKIRPKKFYILHTSKTDGTYKLIEIHDMNKLIKEAKLVLKLSDALDRLTESKKKIGVQYDPTRPSA